MNKNARLHKFIIASVLIAALLGAWWIQSLKLHNQQLSVKPQTAYSSFKLEPTQSNIGLHVELPYESLTRAAEQATAAPQTGSGEKQTCKKILGAKACATLHWRYLIQREGKVQIQSLNDRLQLKLPISFAGTVSVGGHGGKLLGLRDKNIDGKLELIADLNIDVHKSWCPELQSDISYRWLSDPAITLVGSIRINLRKSVDKALRRKLSELESRFADIVDCDKLRNSIKQQWHRHSFDIELTENTTNQLTITPVSASVSDIDLRKDHASMSFELNVLAQVHQPDLEFEIDQPSLPQATDNPFEVLPDLLAYTKSPGTVEFSLLMEVPYAALRDKLAAETVGKTYGSGDSHSFMVTSVALYPAEEILIIDVGFTAKAFRSFFETTGNVYISAKPVADPINNLLRLENLQLTRTIDSKLLAAMTTILQQQLLNALQDVSVIDLDEPMAKIESSVEKTLSNPRKTAGIKVNVQPPQVRLLAVNPQANGLAAVVHLSTKLHATVPDDVLIR